VAGHRVAGPDAALRAARVARLATADRRGRPHVVPICFAAAGRRLYSPIDEKPKRAAPRRLKRVRNILANPHVALVVDAYREDWRRLWYVLVFGTAEVIPPGAAEHTKALRVLRQKYRQYRAMRLEERPVLGITSNRVVMWRAVMSPRSGALGTARTRAR
jgi:PPOX class probable F420-dependent enzyme